MLSFDQSQNRAKAAEHKATLNGASVNEDCFK